MRRLVPAVTALVVAATASAAAIPLAVARPSTDDTVTRAAGLSERIVAAGLCRGKARYRVVVDERESSNGDTVTADLTVRRAGERTRWGAATEASTVFGDGHGVTGNTDGFARSSKRGVIRLGAATPAGRSHAFEFFLSRMNGADHCYVRVAA